MQTSECRAAARFYIQSTALFGLNQVCFPGLGHEASSDFFFFFLSQRRELRYFRMRGKDVNSLVVYVLLVLPTSVSSLPSSHLLKTRRIYSQGVDTVLSAAKEQVYTIPLAKISKLPAKVRASYEAQDREFDRYSQHTAKQMQSEFVAGRKAGRKAGIKAGKNSAKIEMARKLSAMNLTVDQIEKATGLSSEDIKGIK